MTKQSTTVQSAEAIRRWRLHAFVTLAATAALTAAPPADAAPRQARPERTTEAAAPRDAGEPIMAIVSIKSQKGVWPVTNVLEGREHHTGRFFARTGATGFQ